MFFLATTNIADSLFEAEVLLGLFFKYEDILRLDKIVLAKRIMYYSILHLTWSLIRKFRSTIMMIG